jgi:trk system potassium uptake protein TrkA
MKAKSFAVLGLGRFGRSVAETLYSMGYDVLAIDKSEECINQISPNITHAVRGLLFCLKRDFRNYYLTI